MPGTAPAFSAYMQDPVLRKTKTPIHLKGRESSFPCYHLFSQAARTACLTECRERFLSLYPGAITRAPRRILRARSCASSLRGSEIVFAGLRCARLSSTGCSLSALSRLLLVLFPAFYSIRPVLGFCSMYYKKFHGGCQGGFVFITLHAAC